MDIYCFYFCFTHFIILCVYGELLSFASYTYIILYHTPFLWSVCSPTRDCMTSFLSWYQQFLESLLLIIWSKNSPKIPQNVLIYSTDVPQTQDILMTKTIWQIIRKKNRREEKSVIIKTFSWLSANKIQILVQSELILANELKFKLVETESRF